MKPSKIIYIKGLGKLSSAQQVASHPFPDPRRLPRPRQPQVRPSKDCPAPAPSPSPLPATHGTRKGNPSPTGERSPGRRPRGRETRGVGVRGEGVREPESEAAGKEQTRGAEGAGRVDVGRQHPKSSQLLSEGKERGRKRGALKAREARDPGARRRARGPGGARRRGRSPPRLPVLPPPWLPRSGGKMPEHFSHSTWPAKHSSVTMCSAFWHRLFTPSSLWKLIVWLLFPRSAAPPVRYL